MPSEKKTNGLVYEIVLDYVRDELLSGELQAGSQMPTVAALAARLGVGQAAVREAYRLLESKGVLEITQGRGTFVTADIGDIEDVFRNFHLPEQPSRVHVMEARRLLEPGIAALAAQRATDSEIREIVALSQVSKDPLPTQIEWREINIRFHDAIVTAARNPVLARMLRAVYDLMRTSRPFVDDIMPNAMLKAISAHKLIALAIQERDAQAAQVLMYQHIRTMEERLITRGRGGGRSAGDPDQD